MLVHEAYSKFKQELEEISDAAESVNQWVGLESDKIDKKYNSRELTSEEVNLIMNDKEQMRKLNRVSYIPDHIAESLFVLVMSKFEKFMIHICDNVRLDKEDESISHRNTKGDSKLQKMYRFIKNYSVYNYDICRDSGKEWNVTLKLSDLRNYFVHKHLDFEIEELEKFDVLLDNFSSIGTISHDQGSINIHIYFIKEVCVFLNSFANKVQHDIYDNKYYDYGESE